MDHSFSIKSARSDSELVFAGFDGDYFNVELRGTEVSASLRVWGYTDCQLLVELLNHLARQLRGWTSAAEWRSIESDLAIEFRCDSLGHVLVGIELTHCRGVEDWQVRTQIETELGQLPKLAADASAFFQCEAPS
jgi:hypothetical protein